MVALILSLRTTAVHLGRVVGWYLFYKAMNSNRVPMKIEDEENIRNVNSVLWGLSGLSFEEERLGDALSDFELALEVLHAEPWVRSLENRYTLDRIKEAYDEIRMVYFHIMENRVNISGIFRKLELIPTIFSEDFCDDGSACDPCICNWKPEHD